MVDSRMQRSKGQSLSSLLLSRNDEAAVEVVASARALQLGTGLPEPRAYESVLKMTRATPAANGAVKGKL